MIIMQEKQNKRIIATKELLLTSFILVFLNAFVLWKSPENFELLPVLTITASIVLVSFLLPEYYNRKSSTILLLSICVVLKYIVTPFFYCIGPIRSFSHYTPLNDSNINWGIMLMIYELVSVSFTTILFSKNDYKKNLRREKRDNQRFSIIHSSNTVVGLFVLFSITIALFFPISRNGLSFFVLKANTGVRVSSMESSSIGVLLREFVLIGFYSIFILIAVSCAKKYMRKGKTVYITIALLFAVFVTGIIVSEARSSQIYCGFACITLLGVLFPEKKKNIQCTMFFAILAFILALTIYKTFYAFRYESYTDAIFSADIGAKTITYNLETYCLGPLHYTAIIELGYWNETFTLSRFLFGLLRTVMGTNLIVKNIDMNTTSMVFNQFVSGNRMSTGYLLPITGLGYFYLSPILSPVFTCFVYRIASKLEYKMKSAQSAFSLFFMAYVYIRVATCIVSTNINTILSMSSMVLLTAGIIAAFNKKIKIKKLK